jgi:BNR repeat-containing family member
MMNAGRKALSTTTAAAVAAAVLVGLGGLAAPGTAAAAQVPEPRHGHGKVLVSQAIATGVAVRSDRRAMGGGVYDPVVQKTFVSWMGKDSDSYVQAYDHRSRVWSAPKRVGGSFPDPHNYPNIVQADDGRLLVLHGSHNSGQMLASAPTPHSIDGEWTDKEMPEAPGSTYPMVLKASNGDIYVFFRETTRDLVPRPPGANVDDRPMEYIVSTDDGATWKTSKELTGKPFILGSVGRADNMNEIYVGQIRATPRQGRIPERFHLVWTLAGGGPTVHDHDRYHRNLYYAAFQPSNRHFYSVTGRDLGEDIDGDEMEAYTKALHTELVRAKPLSRDIGYTHLVRLTPDGKPVLVYNRQEGDATVVTSARWMGRYWVFSPGPRTGMLLDMEPAGGTAMRVYVATPPAPPGTPNPPPTGIQTYLLKEGAHWVEGELIWTLGQVQRADVIPNYRDPVRLVVTGQSSTADQAIADGHVYAVGAY